MSIRPRLVLCVAASFALLAPSSADARRGQDGAEGVLDGMVYRYFLPENYDPAIDYPLLLHLHGSGESGTDNNLQVNAHIRGLINKTESDYPAILVVPQLPRSTGWSPFNPIDNTSDVLAHLIDTYSVDEHRLYVTGLSMGGFGAMEYAQRYNAEGMTDLRFAAVVPLSGAFIDPGRPGVPDELADTAFWLGHGARDGVVSVETSRETFRVLAGLEPTDPIDFTTGESNLRGGMTAQVGNVRYTEFPRGGHNIWSPIYNDPALFEWMFAQSTLVPEPASLLAAAVATGCCLLRRP